MTNQKQYQHTFSFYLRICETSLSVARSDQTWPEMWVLKTSPLGHRWTLHNTRPLRRRSECICSACRGSTGAGAGFGGSCHHYRWQICVPIWETQIQVQVQVAELATTYDTNDNILVGPPHITARILAVFCPPDLPVPDQLISGTHRLNRWAR